MDTGLKAGFAWLAAALCTGAQASTLFNNPYPIGPDPQIDVTWIFDKPTGETILFEAVRGGAHPEASLLQ
jgi:hypothetical protein